ncbi:zinc ABC transporter substrate-binding protein [Candidatus Bathyarchaeota archaeon]|nr:zinc ABC transporter substrate-binding protein [Candidatus Bathyarchaeota archaeon]
MNKKQKMLIIATILSIAILIIVASAFFTVTQPTGKLQVVASFYPLAFFSQEIGGEHVQVTQLVPSNTEIHTWEPAASDISAAEKADVIVYNGAGLDHWIETEIFPAISKTKNRAIVDTTENLPLLLAENNQEHENENEHGIYDPHTWVSPHMAKVQAEKIYVALVQQDPTHERHYTERWSNLKSTLEKIDVNYTTTLSTMHKNTIFVSHAAFGYLANRYEFKQQGVIGLSADQQPSAVVIANIISLMLQHETYVVYVDPVYSQGYAQTLKNELETQTGHSVTILKLYLITGQIDGKSYLQQQLFNLESLRVGLEA